MGAIKCIIAAGGLGTRLQGFRDNQSTKILLKVNSKLRKNIKFDENINQIGYSIDQNLIPGYSQNVVFEFLRK